MLSRAFWQAFLNSFSFVQGSDEQFKDFACEKTLLFIFLKQRVKISGTIWQKKYSKDNQNCLNRVLKNVLTKTNSLIFPF